MKRFLLVRAAPLCIAACTTLPTPQSDGANLSHKDEAAPTLATCAGRSSPNCQFRNSPVKLDRTPVRLPRRALTFYPTVEPLEFYDASNRQWVAPERTLTDGASIPRLFIDMIGDPKATSFVNAAAVHDAYCGVGNEQGPRFQTRPWRETHRMFYDALRVGGTPRLKAKVMFAAVYIGGPRWPGTQGVAPILSTQGRAATVPDWRGNAGLSAPVLRRVLRETVRFIEAEDPGLLAIERYAEARLERYRAGGAPVGEGPGTMTPAGQEGAPGVDIGEEIGEEIGEGPGEGEGAEAEP